LKIFVSLLLLFSFYADAQEKYSMRLVYGQATTNSLLKVVTGRVGSHPENLHTLALDGGYLLTQNLFDLPVDIYLKGGVSYFNEGAYDDTYEMLTYVKAFYNVDFADNRMRFGFGEGVSYTTSLLEAERYESSQDGGNTSKFLNYLDISIDFDIGKFLGSPLWEETYVGILLKHRSGIYGLINNVANGGSNYNSIYFERNF